MSSTNRSRKRYSHKEDYYVTPQWCVREFLNVWVDDGYCTSSNVVHPKHALVLDPCAGGDATNPMTYPTVLEEWGFNPVTMDLRADSPCQFPGENFLTADFMDLQFDMIITNPPYNLAVPFIERALELTKPMGWVVMLLRVNFLGAQKRGEWWQTHMPESMHTHSRRPCFYPDNWKEIMPWLEKKGTDSTEYAHFVWQKGNTGNPFRGFVIPHEKGVSDAPGPYPEGDDK
jgi:hypothetical protein